MTHRQISRRVMTAARGRWRMRLAHALPGPSVVAGLLDMDGAGRPSGISWPGAVRDRASACFQALYRRSDGGRQRTPLDLDEPPPHAGRRCSAPCPRRPA